MTDKHPASREVARSGVQSLDRAVRILECFTADRDELGVTAISRDTGLTSSTVHRILRSLQVHQLVEQAPGRSTYRLGPHVLRLAHAASARMTLSEQARPVMRALRDAVDETVGLHEYRGIHERAVIEQAESSQALRRTYTEIGQAIPIHQGAPGKMLLASLPAADRERVLAGDLREAMDGSRVDVPALVVELDRIREQGFARSYQGRIAGITSIAVPVRDHRGEVIAAISVSGPSARFTDARVEVITREAQQRAVELSILLGAPGDAAGPTMAAGTVTSEEGP